MSKTPRSDPDIADEYDFSKAVRGKHYHAASDGIRISMVPDEDNEHRERGSTEIAEEPPAR